MDLKDEKTLYLIKQKFGGTIKLKSKSIKYKLQHKKGIINLINNINGNIRTTTRLIQFNNICNILNIKLITPIELKLNNSWFIGFFDAKGNIKYSYINEIPDLIITISSKYLIDIKDFKLILGGNIFYNKGNNGNFKWKLKSEKDILNWINNYVKYNPSRSSKLKQLTLIKKFYELKSIKAYIKSSILYKTWLNLESKFNN